MSFLVPPGEVCDWRMAVLYDAAAEAGVIAALPGRAGDLARGLSLDPDAVRVVLDALGSWRVVDLHADGVYRPGPAAPSPDSAAVLHQHVFAVRRWSRQVGDRLRGPVESGGAERQRPHDDRWLESMAVGARLRAPAYVDACLARFPGAKSVLELGGGHGEYGLEFARRGLQVTMQDRPEMVAIGRDRLSAGGVTVVAGDFFEQLPDGPFDLVFCAGINHTFDGEHNASLFRRLRPITAPGGGVAVFTFLRRHDPIGAIFAVQMLLNSSGGDTHGEDDYRGWLIAAAYEPLEIVDLGGDGSQSGLFAAAGTGQG